MVINKSRIYTFTVVAVLAYLFLHFMVSDNPFGGPFFGDRFWKTLDGSWLPWLCLVLIPVLGAWQASHLGDREINITPSRAENTPGQVNDPVFWQALTGNVWFSVLWLPLRFVLGINWLQAGYHKIFDAGWAQSGTVQQMRDGEMVEVYLERGQSMKGFLAGAAGVDMEGNRIVGEDGVPVVGRTVFGWYEDFLVWIVQNDHTSWFGPMVAFGETLVGLGLLFGALLGVAAFFGTMMNMNFMLAGTVSSNPWMFGLTVFVILGWKVAGYLGLDRWLLPMLGTPWTSDEDAVAEATGTHPINTSTPVTT